MSKPKETESWPGELLPVLGGELAARAAESAGTPVVLFDEAALLRRLRWLRDSLDGFRLLVPYKSCSLRALRTLFHRQGLGADCASDAELEEALAAGLDAGSVYLNAPRLSDAALAKAVEAGATLVVDEPGSVDRIRQAADSSSTAVAVMLRVDPGVGKPVWSRFGFDLDGEELTAAVAAAAAAPLLDLRGLHFHLGTNIEEGEGFEQAVERVAGRWASLEAGAGGPLRTLNMGGGFATPSACPWDRARASWRPRPPGTAAAHVREKLAREGLLERVDLLAEPGRVLLEESGVLLTRVVSSRRKRVGRFLACDSGINHVPTSSWLKHPIRQLSPGSGGGGSAASERLVEYEVFGSLCMQADVLGVGVALRDDLDEGDLLAIGSVGAYDVAMSFPFIWGRCPVLLHRRDGTLELIRRRELTADMHRLE